RGALSLETLEPRAVFDGDVLTDLRPDEANRARELIEDFMIAANGVTAKFLEARGFPALRRVLRAPERWERIVALAADLGERLPGAPNARALEAFLAARRRADSARFPDLSPSVVQLLGSGDYVPHPPGGASRGSTSPTGCGSSSCARTWSVASSILRASGDARSPDTTPVGRSREASMRHRRRSRTNALLVLIAIGALARPPLAPAECAP